MLIRVRSSQGMLRVEVQPQDSILSLQEKVAAQFNLGPESVIFAKDPNGSQIVNKSPSSTISSEGIKHGDMLFLGVRDGVSLKKEEEEVKKEEPQVIEDQVDVELGKQSGRIEKKKSSSSNGTMKLEDLPIEPYSESYLTTNKIKHMSYHSYIRKMQDRQRSSGLSLVQNLLTDPVEDLLKKTLKKGKTKLNIKELAQPIFLERQPFRMVDHVEFETSEIVNTFLQAWRETGIQRFGYLFGRYEQHADVPLGIKAVVSCIYEPPQQGNSEGVELDLPDKDEDLVNSLAANLGLVKVGMIYTDLHDDGTGKGKVLYKRNGDTYFLSSPEIIFAAMHQNAHPSPSKYSDTGKFGSKFVTVVVSGNEKNEIELEAYQVSNQCMAMVAADICQATVEATVLRVNESNEERYVPDVLFKHVNEFGTSFMHTASPTFPVEHLIVNVGHGFPKEPRPFFITPKPFPFIENRPTSKDMRRVKEHLAQGNILQNLSDFHLLFFILKTETFDLQNDYVLLLECAKKQERGIFEKVTRTPSWQTFMMLVNEAALAAPSIPGGIKPAPAGAKAQYQEQLALLKEMGFPNEEFNLSLLHRHNGNLENVLHALTM